jgi:dUTP pyrophosphatase
MNQNNITVKLKPLRPDWKLPTYAHKGDAGLDMTATTKTIDEFGNTVYGTSLALQLPEGHVGLLFPRSSICKKQLFLTNSVGIIDQGYQGEILFKFKSFNHTGDENLNIDYNVGERIGQLIVLPIPYVNIEVVSELDNSERGEGGYGSSGN